MRSLASVWADGGFSAAADYKLGGMSARIRPVTPADLPALGAAAYQTGFFGESAARYFPDSRLFALLWVWPYLHGAGGPGCLAAVNERGELLGYILGAAEPARYDAALAQAVLLGAAATLGGEVRGAAACWRYLLRLTRYAAPHADPRLYPAHLHINLRTEARGQGLGRTLLQAHLQVLEAAGVRGVQLSTTAENAAALHLYRREGFAVLHQTPSDFWVPWLGRPTAHIIMGRRLGQAAG